MADINADEGVDEYLQNLWSGLTKDELAKPINTVEEKWKLVPAFIKAKGFVNQHIDSYNHLVEVGLQEIIASNRVITTEQRPQWFLEYTNVYVRPNRIDQIDLTPHQCRLRDLTYNANILVDVRYVVGSVIHTKTGVLLGRLPIMLRSNLCVLSKKSDRELVQLNECCYDPGGYFVVRGVEKVILIQEQLSKNRIIIETDKKNNIMASVASSTYERKSKTLVIIKHDAFYLQHNSFTDDIPIIIILKAMGFVSDQQILSYIGTQYSDILLPSIDEVARLGLFTQIQCLEYIASRIRTSGLRLASGYQSGLRTKATADLARDNLASVIFCHINVLDYNFFDKAVYTCIVVRRMCQAIVDPSHRDDRDYYGNKRLELAGQLLSLLFEDLFRRHNAELKRLAEHGLTKQTRGSCEAFDIMKSFSDDLITNSLTNAISTGNWVVKRFKMDRAGVTQVLSRLSFIAAVGMMTRITSQFEKTRKVSGPRSLQGSQWGVLCPSDTPEGEACGLVKNLALMADVTVETPEQPVLEICLSLGVHDISLFTGHNSLHRSLFIVFLNGSIIGTHNNPTRFRDDFCILRRNGLINPMVSITIIEEQRFIYISSDGGRLCRPLIIVKNGISQLTSQHVADVVNKRYPFEHLLTLGAIEYLDVQEQNNCLIAVREHNITSDTTHLEIDPMTILGVVAGLIPYPHHNQSPRNTYQCAMGKQAMGVAGYNQHNRIDTLLYLLVYPQRPMVQSHTIEMVGFDKLPAGQSATVFVMSYSGYDIEDASILNRSGLDRGFGRCMVMKKQVITAKHYPNGTQDQILSDTPRPAPPGSTGPAYIDNPRGRVLDLDGITRVGIAVENNDILVNKWSPKDTESPIVDLQAAKRDRSNYKASPSSYKGPEVSYVDQVLLTSNDREYLNIKVLLRSTRRPELGDKFSSRHGQKGVCGLIAQQEDMPFTEQGVYPDLVMNPHGFPSRMTVGKLLELVAGKAGVLNGYFAYGTAFGGDNIQRITHGLISQGFSPSGKEILTCGMTGEPLAGLIFAGPIFYQKLKHMVMDKMHARSRGPRAILTRQPTEGRSRDGGLRLGEMERDCLIGYGAASVVSERLLHSADRFQAHVCLSCGLVQPSDSCQSCSVGATVNKTYIDHGNNNINTNGIGGHNIVRSNNNTTVAKTTLLTLPYACKLLFQELQSMNILPRLRLETL